MSVREDLESRSLTEAFRAIQGAGKMALRGIFILNAGAAAILLAFLAQLGQPELQEVKKFILPVFIFALGATSTVLASGLMHFMHIYHHNTLLEFYSENHEEADKLRSFKRFFKNSYIFFGVIGLVTFLATLVLLYLLLFH